MLAAKKQALLSRLDRFRTSMMKTRKPAVPSRYTSTTKTEAKRRDRYCGLEREHSMLGAMGSLDSPIDR